MARQKKKEGARHPMSLRHASPRLPVGKTQKESIQPLWFLPRFAYSLLFGSSAIFVLTLLWRGFYGLPPERVQAVGSFGRLSYQASERPQFTIAPKPGMFRVAQPPEVRLVTLTDSHGRKQSVTFHPQPAQDVHRTTVAVDPPLDFQPGRYQATVIAEQGGSLRAFQQDFTWGVLALNVPSATVQPWEDVPLHIAALDDAGAMVCDAQVTLTVTDPNGDKTVYRSGERKLPIRPIGVNPECSRKERTERPDYEAHYRPEMPGRYTVRLTAKTESGTRELSDAFTVVAEQRFSVRREQFPTRLYPAAAYPVAFLVQPNVDFHGTVEEIVPASFSVTDVSDGGKVLYADQEQHTIRWNVRWKAGQKYRLGYTFDAPDTSPAFYTLGPLVIGAAKEGRPWQLAIDGSEQFIAFTDGSVPTGWTCISCQSGDPFYQKFPRGNTTYGGTGGSDTHTHTMALVSTPNNGTSSSLAFAGTVTVAGTLDTHGTMSGTSVGSATSLPLYRNLKVILYNQTGNPSTIPSGVIALFDAAPSGSWTRYTNQDGYFIRGGNDNNVCSDACSTTNTHTFSGTLDTDASVGSDPVQTSVSGTIVSAILSHNHAFSGTTAASDHTPTRTNALLYQATATVPTPSGIIGLWSAAPPSGWTSVSGVGSDFNGRLLDGASSYSVPAANNTHTPSNAVVASGSTSNSAKVRAAGAITVSLATHTHDVTVSFDAANNLPSYFDAIIAKKNAAANVTISGTIYTDEGTTAYNCSTNNLTVAIRVNGAGTYSGTCSASNGTYSVGSVSISAGDIVTVFLDGETEKAATVTRATIAAISGFDLYQNRLIVRDEDGSAISNADLGVFDSDNDADVPFTSNSNALSVSSGTELHVWTGKTFTPGGTVTTTASSSPSSQGGDVHIASSSTLSMGTNTLSVGGDYNNAGTFSKSTGHTTTFTATATGFSITPGTGNFDSLTFNGSGGGWSPSAALAVDVDLTLTSGTLSGTQNVTVNGHAIGTAGSIALTSGTFTQRVGSAKNFGTSSGSANWSLNNLTFSNSAGSGVTVTTQSGGSGSITVAGTLTIGNGSDSAGTTLDLANRTWIFTGTSPISVTSSPASTLTIGTSTIRFATTSALAVPLSYSYYNLELRPNGAGSPNYTLGSGASQTLTVTNNLTFGDGTNAVTIKADTYNPATNVGGSVTINANVTYTKGSGTFTFNGTTAGTFTDSTSTPQNLGSVSINKTDTVAPSTNNKVTLASSMTVDTLSVDGTSGSADTFNLGSFGYTLKLANAGSTANVLTVSGTLTAGTSTAQFSATNSGGNINIPALAYSSIQFSSAETYVLTGNLSGANAISGNATIDSGATLDVVADSDYAMAVAGGWSNSGTFRPRSGAVTFNGSSAQTINNGSSAFNDLVIANTGTAGTSNDDVIPSSDLTINDDLAVTSGQCKLSTNDPNVTVAGDVSIGASGIVTKGSGTFTFNGTTAATFTDSTSTPQNLGIVSINKTDTVAPSTNNKVTLASSMTVDTLTIDGTSGSADTFNLGSSGYSLKLANTGSSANVLTVNGTLTAGTSTVEFAATNSSGSITVPVQTYSSLTLSGNETYAAAGSMAVSGNLAISGGTFSAPSGTLTIGGGFDNDGAFSHNSGTVVFSASSGTQHIDADGTGSESFSNVTFSGSATWNMDSSVTVENVFTQSAGTIYASQTTLAVAGNFVHSGGTFVGNGGTVLLNGSDQAMSGTTTFANLSKTVTSARTLTFSAGETQTITGTLALAGTDGVALSLRSSTSGTQWKFDPQGTRSIEYLDVRDSNNVNASKIATAGSHVANSGNNTGWAFPPNAPTGFSGTAISSTSILWTWTDASDNETGFKLEAADGTVLLTADLPNAQSVTETGLAHGTSYTRRVVAYNADGVSDTSRTDTVTTRASAPSIPELISPSDGVLLNTLTPTFSFHRSADDDDGMGTYALFLNPNAENAKIVFLGSVPTSGSESQDLATVTGTDDSGTAQLTDDTLLQEGANAWQIRAMDTAENPSDSVTRTMVIDVTKPTLTAFSLTPQANGSKASAYLSVSQQPTLTLSAQDNYQLDDTVAHFLRRRFLLGEEIGRTEELALTVPMTGKTDTARATPKTPLPYGVYLVRIETSDAAGNSSITERSVTLQTAEKISQRPAAPGTTPSEEREKEIEQGETPTKIPEDLTLPNLEKRAFERREKEASNFTAFVLHFVSKGSLERFERSMNRMAHGTRSFLTGIARSSGRRVAAFFGFTSQALVQLRSVMQMPACGADCASQEELVRESPLGETLQHILPKATGRVLVALKTLQNRATRLLIAGRKNRSQVASNNEAIIAGSLQPVTRAARWIGVGVRVALEGMRGKYEQQLQITDVAINAGSPDAATITWKTNRVSKGKLNYGQTISYGQEALEQAFVTDHKVELRGLQPGTKYYFEVLATDIEGGQTFDAYYGFTTLAL